MGRYEYKFAEFLHGRVTKVDGVALPEEVAMEEWLQKEGRRGWELVSVRLPANFYYKATLARPVPFRKIVWQYMFAHVAGVSGLYVREVDGITCAEPVLWEKWLNRRGNEGWVLAGEMTKPHHREFWPILKRSVKVVGGFKKAKN